MKFQNQKHRKPIFCLVSSAITRCWKSKIVNDFGNHASMTAVGIVVLRRMLSSWPVFGSIHARISAAAEKSSDAVPFVTENGRDIQNVETRDSLVLPLVPLRWYSTPSYLFHQTTDTNLHGWTERLYPVGTGWVGSGSLEPPYTDTGISSPTA